MVVKPNVERAGGTGASMAHRDLTTLDQERAASMADEGGATGAYAEHQPEVDDMAYKATGPLSWPRLRERIPVRARQPIADHGSKILAVAAVTFGAVAVGLFIRNRQLSRQALPSAEL